MLGKLGNTMTAIITFMLQVICCLLLGGVIVRLLFWVAP